MVILVAGFAKGLSIGRIEDQREQFFDMTAMVGICRSLAASLTGVVSLFKNDSRPLFHLLMGVQPVGDGFDSSPPMRCSFTNQVFRLPFPFALARAEEIHASLGVPRGYGLFLSALGTSGNRLSQSTTSKGLVARTTAEAVRLAISSDSTARDKDLAAVLTGNGSEYFFQGVPSYCGKYTILPRRNGAL